MNCKIISDYKDFIVLRNEWNALLKNSRANSVFMTWEWMDSWWQTYRTTEALHIISIRDGDELVGIAPMVTNTIPSGLLKSVNALYFIGIRSDQKLTEYVDIIVKAGSEDDVCKEVIRIVTMQDKGWDVLIFNEVPEYSVTLTKIKELLSSAKLLFSESSHGCSVIIMPDDYDKYLKGLKPRVRTKLRSLPRRLREKHDVELEICTGGDGLQETMESFYALHQRRWESEDQLGTFKDKRKAQFYERINRYFIEKKWLRIYSLKVDGQYRAHEYGFLYNNRLYILQEGFDPEWLNSGVGNVLRTLVIKDCIDKGIEEYDFLGGVTYHKNSWGVHIKNSVSYTFGRRTPGAYIYFYLPVFIEKIKEVYRALMPQKLVQWRIDWYNERKAKKARRDIANENV